MMCKLRMLIYKGLSKAQGGKDEGGRMKDERAQGKGYGVGICGKMLRVRCGGFTSSELPLAIRTPFRITYGGFDFTVGCKLSASSEICLRTMLLV